MDHADHYLLALDALLLKPVRIAFVAHQPDERKTVFAIVVDDVGDKAGYDFEVAGFLDIVDNLAGGVEQEDARIDVRPDLDVTSDVSEKLLGDTGAVERLEHLFEIIDLREQIAKMNANIRIEMGVLADQLVDDQETGDVVIELPRGRLQEPGEVFEHLAEVLGPESPLQFLVDGLALFRGAFIIDLALLHVLLQLGPGFGRFAFGVVEKLVQGLDPAEEGLVSTELIVDLLVEGQRPLPHRVVIELAGDRVE